MVMCFVDNQGEGDCGSGKSQDRRADVDPPESRRMRVGESATTTQPRGPRDTCSPGEWGRDTSSRCVSLETGLDPGLAREEGANLGKGNLWTAEDSRALGGVGTLDPSWAMCSDSPQTFSLLVNCDAFQGISVWVAPTPG